MDLKTKNKILSYLESHNDGSGNASILISKMKSECNYADTASHTVSIEDLKGFRDQTMLRGKLSKSPDEPYTMDDCETVANAMSDWIADNFCEDMGNAIEYNMY